MEEHSLILLLLNCLLVIADFKTNMNLSIQKHLGSRVMRSFRGTMFVFCSC